ncbi:MAG TPA: glycosyltransferase [Candidatus Paceibacterota bacterium]|nr:glycosyltransferase [Candidatus Paceibacterota bacterium]
METPAVSIIIPTLNEEQYLPRLLNSLRNVSSPLDIIVVDGASEDNTVQVVQKYQTLFTGNASLTLVQSTKRGISLQRNKGAAKAKYSTLMFCDADVAFSSKFAYEKLVTTFQEKKYVVAAPVLWPIEPGVNLRLAYITAFVVQTILLIFHRPFFPGSCIMTTKEVFTVTGGFDTNIALAEDIDYSLRANQHGSSGLIHSRLPVSARRVIKYGYGWLFSEIPNVFRLLFTGKIKPETIYYPFGEYGGQRAHHVTTNTGE